MAGDLLLRVTRVERRRGLWRMRSRLHWERFAKLIFALKGENKSYIYFRYAFILNGITKLKVKTVETSIKDTAISTRHVEEEEEEGADLGHELYASLRMWLLDERADIKRMKEVLDDISIYLLNVPRFFLSLINLPLESVK